MPLLFLTDIIEYRRISYTAHPLVPTLSVGTRGWKNATHLLSLFEASKMEIFFLILLVLMLFIFGYAQSQKDVFKTPGQVAMNEEDELETR
jgi:hypothetical protein